MADDSCLRTTPTHPRSPRTIALGWTKGCPVTNPPPPAATRTPVRFPYYALATPLPPATSGISPGNPTTSAHAELRTCRHRRYCGVLGATGGTTTPRSPGSAHCWPDCGVLGATGATTAPRSPDHAALRVVAAERVDMPNSACGPQRRGERPHSPSGRPRRAGQRPGAAGDRRRTCRQQCNLDGGNVGLGRAFDRARVAAADSSGGCRADRRRLHVCRRLDRPGRSPGSSPMTTQSSRSSLTRMPRTSA
jgi:hypothetical protein